VAAEAALRVMLESPERCVIVVDRSRRVVGRLTLPALLRSMLARPPWMHALQLAMAEHDIAYVEIER
jgi:hypothetical protein